MWGSICSALCYIASSIYYFFYYSLKFGHLLVYITAKIITGVFYFFHQVQNLLTILWESFNFFSEDISGTAHEVHKKVFDNLRHYSLVCYNTVNDAFLIYEGIFSVFFNLFKSVGLLFVSLKHFLVIFGKGVWFAIKFFPETFVVIIQTFLKYIIISAIYIKNLFVSGYINLGNGLNEIIIFVIDVPLESLVGLIIALCLGYIVFQFYAVIHNYFSIRIQLIKWRYEEYKRRQAVETEMKVLNKIQGELQRELEKRRKNKVMSQLNREPELNADHQNCIVCRERPKCILILPCRHVCLCNECLHALLQLDNKKCPLCRIKLESTMKVFV